MARLVFAFALILLALWTVRSYAVGIAWAAVIAIAIWPAYEPLEQRLGQRPRWLAPLLATIGAAILLTVPVFVAIAAVGREAQAIVTWIGEAQQSGFEVPDWVKRLPLVGERLGEAGAVQGFLGDLNVGSLAAWGRDIGGDVAYRVVIALVTFMTLFLLLRDGAAISARLVAVADRWLGRPGERLMEKMVVAVRGVVNGTVIVAVAEGVLIGIGYVLADVPRAILFAILTAAFAMLPLGAWFAFTAATIALLLAGGSLLAAVMVFAWGAVVMLIGDNFVQPALIGGAARLPFLLTLIGILGGLETFGLVGLFLGPVIMAALLTVCREWIGDPG